MADKTDKAPGNVLGKYYVDNYCTNCDLCRSIAPEIFKENEDEGVSIVYKQPENDEEVDLVVEAMESCPEDAIGDDGEEVEETAAGAAAGTA